MILAVIRIWEINDISPDDYSNNYNQKYNSEYNLEYESSTVALSKNDKVDQSYYTLGAYNDKEHL